MSCVRVCLCARSGRPSWPLLAQPPRPGIEPGSSARQAEILTAILPRALVHLPPKLALAVAAGGWRGWERGAHTRMERWRGQAIDIAPAGLSAGGAGQPEAPAAVGAARRSQVCSSAAGDPCAPQPAGRARPVALHGRAERRGRESSQGSSRDGRECLPACCSGSWPAEQSQRGRAQCALRRGRLRRAAVHDPCRPPWQAMLLRGRELSPGLPHDRRKY